MELKEAPEVTKTPEQTAIDNQLGVISVIERLFRAVNAASFPLQAHEDVMAGMNFMAQFHKQLVGQLPPAVVEEMKKKAQVVTNEKPV